MATNFVENCAARLFDGNRFITKDNIDWPMSLILKGPSRARKTAWARSLGQHNYICGHMDFDTNAFRNDVMYNIVDDIAAQYLKLKHWKELIGAHRCPR